MGVSKNQGPEYRPHIISYHMDTRKKDPIYGNSHKTVMQDNQTCVHVK